jgi:hypothetical protein
MPTVGAALGGLPGFDALLACTGLVRPNHEACGRVNHGPGGQDDRFSAAGD